jgi:hypothetical protein
MTSVEQKELIDEYHKRLMNSSRKWEIYKDYEFEYRSNNKLMKGDIDLFAYDVVNGKPNILIFNSTKKNYPNKLQHGIEYLKEEYGPDTKIYTFKINKFGNRWIPEKQLDKRETAGLEKKIFNDKHLQKFEDQFTPGKLHAYLRHELNMPKHEANYYSKLFEDKIYVPVIKVYKMVNKK